MTTDTEADVRCNMCGWKGCDEDLELVMVDTVTKDPSRPCPICKTDAYLMDAPWEHEI